MASAKWHYTVPEILDYLDNKFNIPDDGVNSDIKGLDEEDFDEEKGIQWFRLVTSSPRYSSPLKEPGSPPKTIEFAPCTSGSCLSTSLCQCANRFLFVFP